MTFAAIFLVLFLVIGVARLGSRDRDRYDDEEYHYDPYYYFPRNPPPPYYGGYAPPQLPYYQQAPPPVQYIPVRRQSSGGSFFVGLILFVITVALLFYLGIKMGVMHAQLTFGSPPATNPLEQPYHPAPATGSDFNSVAYAKTVK